MTDGRQSKSMTLMMHTSTTSLPTMTVNLMMVIGPIWSPNEKEEAKFNLVNPIVEEMYAYMQRHYDKQPMWDSALTNKAYMDKVTEGNPAKCYEMFRMTPELLLHLVDELAQHGYLRDGCGEMNAT